MRKPLHALGERCEAGASGAVIPVDIAAAKAIVAAVPVAETETLDLLAQTAACSPPTWSRAWTSRRSTFRDGWLCGEGRHPFGTGSVAAHGDGRIAAGDAPARSFVGSVRILTGAPVPQGFDTVVMQEKCRLDGDAIVIDQKPRAGQSVRIAEEDVRRGESLLDAGEMLKAQHLALLAGQGMADIEVRRKVRVGLRLPASWASAGRPSSTGIPASANSREASACPC